MSAEVPLYPHECPEETPIDKLAYPKRVRDVYEQMMMACLRAQGLSGSDIAQLRIQVEPQTAGNFNRLLQYVMSIDGHVPYVPDIILSPYVMDGIWFKLDHVMRWVSGKFPPIVLPDNPIDREDFFFEPDSKHVVAIMTHVNEVLRKFPSLGAALSIDTVRWIALLHDLGEHNGEYSFVCDQHSKDPYSQMAQNEPYWEGGLDPGMDFFYVDPNSEQPGLTADEKTRIERQAVQAFVYGQAIPMFVRDWLMDILFKYEDADTLESLEALFVKYMDKVVGGLVGLMGPFIKEKYYYKGTGELEDHIIKSLKKIHHYYLLLRGQIRGVARDELDMHFELVLRHFFHAEYGEEVGILQEGERFWFVSPSY